MNQLRTVRPKDRMTRLPNRLQSIALLLLWFAVGPGGLHGVALADDEPRPEDVDVDTAVKLGMEKLAEAQQFIEDEEILKAVHRIKWAELYLKRAPEDHVEAVYGWGVARLLMGDALYLNGQTEQAMVWWIEASKQFQHLAGDKALGYFRHAISKTAEAAVSIKSYEQALLSLQNLYRIDIGLKSDSNQLVNDLQNIALALRQLGRLGEANQTLDTAEGLIGKGDVSPELQAEHYYHRGLICNDLQKPRAAAQYFEKSLQLLKSLPDTKIRQSEYLLNIANALQDPDRPAEAYERLQKTLKLVRKRLPGIKATALSLELQIAKNSGEYEKDPKAYIARLQAIEEEARSIPGTERIRVVCLMNVGVAMMKVGQIDQAIASTNSALGLLPKLDDTHNYAEEIHRTLGILWAIQGKPHIANKHFLKSLSGFISKLAADLPGMIDKDKYISINNSSHIPLTEVIHTLCFADPSGDGIQGFQATLWSKALYSEVCRREQPMFNRVSTPEQQRRVAHYQELRRKISRRTLINQEGTDDSHNAQLTEFVNELRQVELSLRRDPEVYREEFRFTLTPVRDVVSSLGPGQILLEFAIYDPPLSDFSKDEEPRYGVYVVNGGDGSIRAIPLGPTERIDNAILAYLNTHREQLFRNANDERILRQRGAAIRELVLDPVLKSLKGIDRIYVAPDGLVGMFPFEVLPVETTRYLVEETQVVYLMTGRDLVRKTPAQPGQPPQACWLVGDPAYDASTDQRIAMFQKASPSKIEAASKSQTANGGTLNWDRLSRTRSIISSISALTRKAKLPTHILLDASASEESLWQIRSPRMLVLATHGQLLQEPPQTRLLLNGLVLPDDGNNINRIKNIEDFYETANPLQRNMLILAGANRTKHQVDCYLVDNRLVPRDRMKEDLRPRTPAGSILRELGDGRLTAYEVWDMNLQGTELVVLLACESGLGVTKQGETSPGLRQPEGEGIAGLRQAFMVAGAQSLIMSMWEVPEEDSTQQMLNFFDGWLLGGKTRYEAFHAAQLKTLNDARTKRGSTHPFWWAGFVYFGQPTDRGF